MFGANWGDIYKELGATPVINAMGSVTMLGGSTPVPEVKEAMERADGSYIPLMHLQEKAGEDWITIHVFGLSEGEDKIVGERIAALLSS